MKTKVLLYLAGGLLFFHVAAHSLGHSGWRQAEDPVKQKVIRQMTDHAFPFMGSVHSMADYFEGYGWFCSIALIFFAMVQILCAKENSALVRKLLVVLSVCLMACSALEFIYFFAFAGTITLLSAMATVMAWWQLLRNK